jgi:hypothetical protein
LQAFAVEAPVPQIANCTTRHRRRSVVLPL